MDTMTDQVSRYQHLRAINTQMNNQLVKLLQKDVVEEGARRLGIMRDGILVFDSEEETSVLMDFCLYHVRRDGLNVVQRRLRESPPLLGSDERMLLEAKSRGRFSLWFIEEVRRGVGVEVGNVFTGERSLVIDLGLSRTAETRIGLATRLIDAGGFCMTTGAPLPAYKDTLRKIVERLPVVLGDEEPDWRHPSPRIEDKLAALAIRTCLHDRNKPDARYVDPGDESAYAEPLRVASAAGRNDPCPCGSGMKYKRCCGR